jgi:hypothetical protein
MCGVHVCVCVVAHRERTHSAQNISQDEKRSSMHLVNRFQGDKPVFMVTIGPGMEEFVEVCVVDLPQITCLRK